MYGAILGDIIGSPYEFDRNNIKTKDFDLFSERSEFTDDSVLTLAVAEALMNCGVDADEETMKKALVTAMKKYGDRYPLPDTARNSACGCTRVIQSPITASETGVPCAYRRQPGSARRTFGRCSVSRP